MGKARGLFAWVAVGCSGVSQTADLEPAVCDGILQNSEGGRVDGPFDVDGDGYLDAADPGCASTYSVFALDCDEDDPARHPDALEIQCNGIDDDCNDDTPDEQDRDRDGSPSCEDCADRDPSRSPTLDEVCGDWIDNDCDGRIDPDCGFDYEGSFTLDQIVDYSCANRAIDIYFTDVRVLWEEPRLAMAPETGDQPGTLEGTFRPDGSFSLQGSMSTLLGCTQNYRFSGTFPDEDHVRLTFDVTFGRFACQRCEDQHFELIGTRVR